MEIGKSNHIKKYLLMKKIIFMALIFSSFYGLWGQNLRSTYKNVVQDGITRTKQLSANTITRQDLNNLPVLLQNYLKLCGVVGKERVNNVKIVFKGRMRANPDEPWMYFTSEQYNFFDKPTRAFYIKAKKMGIPANGLHLYQNEKAFMIIKLAGLFKIIDVAGEEMNQSETVTFLNDICFFAPAVLIDMENIEWKELSGTKLEATYKTGSQTIKAVLEFNDEGKLINFISNDRYELAGKEAHQRPWFTPVDEYGKFGQIILPKKAGAWYKRPDGDFCYGEFTTVDVSYNVL